MLNSLEQGIFKKMTKAQEEMTQAITLLTQAIMACYENEKKEKKQNSDKIEKKFDEIIGALKELKVAEPKEPAKTTTKKPASKK